MHKKETNILHSQLSNNLMNYINNNIQSDINIDQIAYEYGISKFHFHKIFKEQMGTNIYETIKSIRLQKASNLLISNKYSTITQIANLCGYSSQTSFIRAFKQRFEQTPKQWRNGGYKVYSNKILSASKAASLSKVDYSYLEAKVEQTPKMKVYYIRHKGYNIKAARVWQKIMAWVFTNKIKSYKQIGIYHDNPIITPLNDCYYVVGISPNNNIKFDHITLPYFYIEEEICATFEVEGKFGDILNLVQWVYHHWLPNSGFETTTTPSFTIFEKNHFLDNDGLFKVKYYLPIRYL